jgi:hypothetical protein
MILIFNQESSTLSGGSYFRPMNLFFNQESSTWWVSSFN